MLMAGFFTNGVGSVVPSVVAADLGNHPLLKGNPNAKSTVTGIVDGTGCVGAAVGQICIAYISSELGWNATFYMLIAMTLISALCLSKLFIREFQAMMRPKIDYGFIIN